MLDTQSQVRRRFISGEQLLPHLARLRFQLYPDLNSGLEEMRRAAVVLDQLPYALGGTSWSLFELARSQQEICLRNAKSEKPKSVKCLQEADRNRLGYIIDGFLDSSRRCQNALMPYVQKRFPTLNLSPDLSKVAKAVEKGKVELPNELVELIESYWKRYGAKLKAYRDLGQHNAIVSAEARVLIQEEKPPALYLVVPNNPEVKSPAQLSYEDPQIHAFPFVFEHFLNLLAFCYSVTYSLIDPQEDRALVHGSSIRSPVRIGAGAPDFYYPLGEPELGDRLARFLETLKTDAESGRQ